MQRTLVLALALSAACQAATADNLLVNGDFERRDAAGLPFGWKGGNPGSTDVANGNRFASLTRSANGAQTALVQSITLQPGCTHLAVSGRMRGVSIVPGRQGHERAHVFLTFLDPGGTACGYGALPGVGGTQTGWVETARLIPVSAKAASVQVAVGLMGAAAGTLEADDLVVSAQGELPVPTLDPTAPLVLEASTWPLTDPAMTLDAKADPQALTVVANTAREAASERWIRLPVAAGRIRISCEMQAKGVQLGSEPSWQTPRVMLTFHDATGAFVPPYGAVPELRADSSGWTPVSVVREIPSGAAYLKLSPGLHRCSGTVSFRSIRLALETPTQP
jgi:hypothetical protein